jgi:hypothetical protein
MHGLHQPLCRLVLQLPYVWLQVNSSVQHLDLSHNMVSDIGARVLAKLLRPSAGCSSCLRTLCLQHNQIGEGAWWLTAAPPAVCMPVSGGLDRRKRAVCAVWLRMAEVNFSASC